MTTDAELDLAAAHRRFAVNCFNYAWELIEQPERSPEEDEVMIHVAHASLWHWSRHEDCSGRNRAIGYWLLARVYVLARRPEEARRYARLCLSYSRDEGPFYLGYAYEALARAEHNAGETALAGAYLKLAAEQAELVEEPEEHRQLVEDLRTIG